MLYRNKTKQTKPKNTFKIIVRKKFRSNQKKNKQENHACGAFEISLRVYILRQEHNQDNRQAGERLLFGDINIGG